MYCWFELINWGPAKFDNKRPENTYVTFAVAGMLNYDFIVFCTEQVYDQDTLSVIFPSIYANSEHRNIQVPQNLEERKRQSKCLFQVHLI